MSAKFDFYDSGWTEYSGTLTDLINDNAFLSLSGGFLTFDMTVGQRVKGIVINKT